MAKYQTSVRTPWSRQRAYDYLRDLEHFSDWDPGITRSERVAGASGEVGSTYDVTVHSFGRDTVMRYEIVDLDPQTRIEARSETGTLRSIDVMAFRDDGDGGCVATYTADLQLKGVLGLADPLLSLMFNRLGDRAAAGLRRQLDGVEA